MDINYIAPNRQSVVSTTHLSGTYDILSARDWYGVDVCGFLFIHK